VATLARYLYSSGSGSSKSLNILLENAGTDARFLRLSKQAISALPKADVGNSVFVCFIFIPT